MKKVLMLGIISLLLYSCDTTVHVRETTQWTFINLIAEADEWQEWVDNNGKNRYYSCSYSVPEINYNTYHYGAVLCYVQLEETQQIMPYVRHYEDQSGAQWTKTVDFEYSEGGLTIFVTNSDFVQDPPGKMNFKLVLIY